MESFSTSSNEVLVSFILSATDGSWMVEFSPGVEVSMFCIFMASSSPVNDGPDALLRTISFPAIAGNCY
jgi:hypothetical protein